MKNYLLIVIFFLFFRIDTCFSIKRLFLGSGALYLTTGMEHCIPAVMSKKYQIPLSQKSLNIRVLLSWVEQNDEINWPIQSEQIMTVTVYKGTKRFIRDYESLEISWRNESLHINNRKIDADTLEIKSDSPLCYDGNKYPGTLSVRLFAGKIYLINSVDIEEYVHCVLRAESWPGWPLEVNKVQAIATRTYVVAKVLDAKAAKRKLPYHIKNSNLHQTYKGLHDYEVLVEAAHQTHGVIMTHNGKPIVAMFDACCGGIIPGKIDDIDFRTMPYLKRINPCSYCNESKLFSYVSRYSADHIQQLLKNQGIDVGSVRDMKIVERDSAGVVKRVMIFGSKGKRILHKHQVYGLCKNIKSFAYTIKRSGDTFAFEGKGFGHHMGLCQWGARAMVGSGWHFKDILRYYYPGIQFMKLKYCL